MTAFFQKLILLVVILVSSGAALAETPPKGFQPHKYNSTSELNYKDGVVEFTIRNRQCSDIDYGDGRGETDCKNGNIRSNMRYRQDVKLGSTVEYRFDLKIDKNFAYAGYFEKAAQGYYPEGWNSALRIASWEGSLLHNFIYMLVQEQ